MLREYSHDDYGCPGCHHLDLERFTDGVMCPACETRYSRLGDLVNFTYPPTLDSRQHWHRDHFDGMAAQYDDLMVQMFGRSEDVFKRQMLRLLDLPPAGSLLEVGVGTGRNLPLLDSMYGGRLSVYGIDLSPGMLVGCASRAHEVSYPVELAVANAEYLPFRDDKFDAVLHFGFINDFPDPARAIREMVRVVRPGGCVVISDDGFPPSARLSPIALELIPKNSAFGAAPPIEHLPAGIGPYQLEWFLGLFYILSFRKL